MVSIRTHRGSLRPDEADSLLDSFMPQYEVVERHCVRVSAPAEITLSAATDIDLLGSPIVRAIVKARELVLGAEPVAVARPKGLLNEVAAMGWACWRRCPGADRRRCGHAAVAAQRRVPSAAAR